MKNKSLKELKLIVLSILQEEKLTDEEVLDLDCIEEMNHGKLIRKCGAVFSLLYELESELVYLEEYSDKSTRFSLENTLKL